MVFKHKHVLILDWGVAFTFPNFNPCRAAEMTDWQILETHSDLRLLHTTSIEYASTQSQLELSSGVVPWWVEVESSGLSLPHNSLSRLRRGKVAFRPEREASASPLWSQLSAQPRRPQNGKPPQPARRPPAMPPTPPETETEPEFAEVDPTGRYGRVTPPFPTTLPASARFGLWSLAPRSRAHAFRTLAVHGGSWQGRLQDGVSFHSPWGVWRLGPIRGRLTSRDRLKIPFLRGPCHWRGSFLRFSPIWIGSMVSDALIAQSSTPDATLSIWIWYDAFLLGILISFRLHMWLLCSAVTAWCIGSISLPNSILYLLS